MHRADQEFAYVVGLGDVPLATYAGRLGARLIDFLILFVPAYFPLAFLFPDSILDRALVFLVPFVVYDAVLTANTGATPGKRFARIKVVRGDSGVPPGWGRSLVRAGVLGALGWVIIAVTALFDERRHRGWHDRAAETVVVAI
jgi:uncharacterized RDD family membrane protein YckC